MGPYLLVTAGPTCEDIDPVRFLSNRSSGRMGLALAAEGVRRGWPVTLVLGPTPLAPPDGAAVVRVRSAKDMAEAVEDAFPGCAALAMAAAVADYTPEAVAEEKIHKRGDHLTLRLVRTVDILARAGRHPARPGKYLLGFSLNRGLDPAEGARKLAEKNLDAVWVNAADAMGSEENEGVLLHRDGRAQAIGPCGKEALAERLLAPMAPLFRR